MRTPRYYVFMAQVIIYAFLLPITLFVTHRQGLFRSLGFLYLSVFCCLRVAGAGLGVASEDDRRNRDNLVWSEILGSVGIGPLLLAGFGLLSRVNMNSKPRSDFRIYAMQVLHLPAVIALALAVVGGVRLSASGGSTQHSGKEFAQAGISIFMAVFGMYLILGILTLAAFRAVRQSERCILYGILLVAPFLFLRILYAMLAVFRDNDTFGIVNGNPMAQLGMGIIEEMIIVIIYDGVGIIAPVDSRIETDDSNCEMQHAGT
ncbi:MAG: hypothetical protein Q9219_004483 [cf. Caloplaca sp. 3 TL-2023]